MYLTIVANARSPAGLENDPLDGVEQCFPSYTTEQGQKQVTALDFPQIEVGGHSNY